METRNGTSVGHCFLNFKLGKFYRMRSVNSGQKITILTFCFLFSLINSQTDLVSKVRLYDINGTKYISALEYAKIQNVNTIFYDDKEKLEFRYQNVKMLLSPHSSFIRVNENIYHMYLPVVYDGNDFFIPADPFLEIVNNIGMPSALMDSSE